MIGGKVDTGGNIQLTLGLVGSSTTDVKKLAPGVFGRCDNYALHRAKRASCYEPELRRLHGNPLYNFAFQL